MLQTSVLIVRLVRASFVTLTLLAAACSSAPLQPMYDGEGNGGTWGILGAAGTIGAAGSAGAAGGPETCLLHYNSAIVTPPADACCAWEGGLNTCDRDLACNDKSGAKCCLIYASSDGSCCLYAKDAMAPASSSPACALLSGAGGIGGTTGAAGSGGGGGTTGAGGNSSDDGGVPSFDAGAPACTQAVQAPATPWTFGFQPTVDPPATFLAMVTEVAADHLTLESDVGQSFVFRWAGPSLAGKFSVGDSVSGQTTADRWHIVKGARAVAEIHLGNSSTMITTSGAIPAGGSFTLEPDCATVHATTCGGTDNPEVHTYYRVVASLGDASVTIPIQSTATLGSLQITNVFQDQGRGGSSSVCHIDFSNVGLISVLGPP